MCTLLEECGHMSVFDALTPVLKAAHQRLDHQRYMLILGANSQTAHSSSSLPVPLFQAASNSLLLQREASALAAQPVQPSQGQAAAAAAAQQQQQAKWPAGGASATAVSSEQLSLELHQVEREIGKRTREMALVRGRWAAEQQ